MSFCTIKKKLHPLVAMFACLTIAVVGFVFAKDQNWVCGAFVGCMFVWLCIFGYGKTCLMVIPAFIFMSGTFFLINWAISGTMDLGIDMASRFAAISIAVVPGIATTPVRMTRSLSQIHAPRAVTLGMLIAMTFTPKLKLEVKRVREAMKTRGAGSILNPVIFYRALIVPFIIRLINISDTLALSVDTRGFSMEKGAKYTIYKKENFVLVDLLFLIGLVVFIVLAALAHVFLVKA